jgi:hypothetical protein
MDGCSARDNELRMVVIGEGTRVLLMEVGRGSRQEMGSRGVKRRERAREKKTETKVGRWQKERGNMK